MSGKLNKIYKLKAEV